MRFKIKLVFFIILDVVQRIKPEVLNIMIVGMP